MIAQLGERQTEDLKVPGSIPGRGILFAYCYNIFYMPLDHVLRISIFFNGPSVFLEFFLVLDVLRKNGVLVHC